MGQRVALAVAGAGKTGTLIEALKNAQSPLVLTYTDNNYNDIRRRIVLEYGCIPENIRLSTYFSFLYGFCLRPFLKDQLRLSGLNFEMPSVRSKYAKKSDDAHYLDQSGRIYHRRAADLVFRREILREVKARVARYHDLLMIDEMQDFAGYDFNFICALAGGDSEFLMVGDFFQHTYDTSREGSVNRNLHKTESGFKARLEAEGFDVDTNSLNKSYRCSPSVCKFVSNRLGISISSHRSDDTDVSYVENQDRIQTIYDDESVIKLFYQSHDKYNCFSENWGKSKGVDTYADVCVVLNPKTDKLFRQEKLFDLAPGTRNKLYVACTRARGNLYLVPQKIVDKIK